MAENSPESLAAAALGADRSTREFESRYAERAREAEKEAQRLEARSRGLSNLRGLAFGAAVVTAIAAFAEGPIAPWLGFALSAFALFVGFVVAHGRVLESQDLAERRADVNRDALARLRHEWEHAQDRGDDLSPAEHVYAADLDSFGRGSLFQRLCAARTRFGRERLAALLLSPASMPEARRRQQAIRVLAAELDLRQRFEAHALGIQGVKRGAAGRERVRRPPNPELLLRWAESEPSLLRDPATLWGARLLPPLSLASLIGFFAFSTTPFAPLGLLALHALLLLRASRDTSRIFAAVSADEGAFLRYGTLLEILETTKLDDPLLGELRAELDTGAGAPSETMRTFRRWVGWFDLRHNGLVHPFVNLVTLWDLHCALGLERWQTAAGKRLRGWFDVIGWFEALSSLGGFAADEPGLSYPELVDGPARFVAEGLVHPLLDAKSRVANDVSLPAPGRALLVTGSNMSGKSTLLRAMGTAAVLARAGAPVSARRLELGALSVETSLRVADSLERGVSHFFAELLRLKGVVDASRKDAPVLFLLDEILHGTNSRERQIGARWILARLLENGALGAVSTHDQELCILPDELMQRVRLVHLRESVASGKMTFDYKVYPGPVTSGNALRLMRELGLEVPLE